MSEDNYAIKPEGDIDKASRMGNSDATYNVPFQPLEGLPSREVAAEVERHRVAIGAKDTIRLEPGTLNAFAAAKWVTKIEFQAVMSHIRILEAEKQEYRREYLDYKNRCDKLQQQVTYCNNLIRRVETKWGAFVFFVHKLWYGKSFILDPVAEPEEVRKNEGKGPQKRK